MAKKLVKKSAGKKAAVKSKPAKSKSIKAKPSKAKPAAKKAAKSAPKSAAKPKKAAKRGAGAPLSKADRKKAGPQPKKYAVPSKAGVKALKSGGKIKSKDVPSRMSPGQPNDRDKVPAGATTGFFASRSSKQQYEVPAQVQHTKLNAAQIRELHQMLLEERDRVLSELNRSMGKSLEDVQPEPSNRFGNHMADVAADAQMLETLLLQSGMENDRMRQITFALEQIEQKKFGVCERCGGNIGIDRLMAKPWARFCIVCREWLEKNSDASSL